MELNEKLVIGNMRVKEFYYVFSVICFQLSITYTILLGFGYIHMLPFIFIHLVYAILAIYISDEKQLGATFTEFLSDGYNPNGWW